MFIDDLEDHYSLPRMQTKHFQLATKLFIKMCLRCRFSYYPSIVIILLFYVLKLSFNNLIFEYITFSESISIQTIYININYRTK